MSDTSSRPAPSWASAAPDQLLGEGRPASNATTFTSNMKLPVHRWYRYSAGYSAEWAADLMSHWGVKHVLDPFAGSGTTLLAAQDVGAESYGVEVHPTVARIAQAKLACAADPDEVRGAIVDVQERAKSPRSVEPPASPLAAQCFPNPNSLNRLLRLREAVAETSDVSPQVADILWLAFVSIIRPTSPAGTAQWQYVLPNKSKSRVLEPFNAFALAADMFISDMEWRQARLGAEPPCAELVMGDARKLERVPDGWADAVITSPPYANNYDYADALRLEQVMLGEIDGWKDLRGLRDILVKSATQNIGKWDSREALRSDTLAPIIDELLPVYDELNEVRMTRGGKKAYHAMLAGYFFDNAKVFEALRQKTASGAKVCYVVGDSAPYGVHAPVERWLGELALAAGFKTWSFSKVRDRNTKWKNRKHTHPLHEGYLWIEG